MVPKKQIKIRSNLNILLTLSVYLTSWALLFLASLLQENVPLVFLLGIVFSFVLLTNYALMHDAAHHVLHVNRKVNYLLGLVSCSLFPQSFTMYEIAHKMHHQGNRTDHETFDYYYPNENPLVKRVQWYGILSGLWYPMIPIGTLLIALSPTIYKLKIFSASIGSIALFQTFKGWVLQKIRFEVLFVILQFILLWKILQLNLLIALLFYALFGINWSTRQYVTHAWTPRDVIEGALNLSTNKLHQAILLNGNWDHVHHKYPHLPWTELSNPKFHEIETVSYFRQYISLWKGPQSNDEPSPEPMLDYSSGAGSKFL